MTIRATMSPGFSTFLPVERSDQLDEPIVACRTQQRLTTFDDTLR